MKTLKIPADQRWSIDRESGAKRWWGLAAEEHLDPEGGDYVTVCDTHGTLVNSDTAKSARTTRCTEFCDDCRELVAAGKRVPPPEKPKLSEEQKRDIKQARAHARAIIAMNGPSANFARQMLRQLRGL